MNLFAEILHEELCKKIGWISRCYWQYRREWRFPLDLEV